jgi:hypothetical protein
MSTERGGESSGSEYVDSDEDRGWSDGSSVCGTDDSVNEGVDEEAVEEANNQEDTRISK